MTRLALILGIVALVLFVRRREPPVPPVYPPEGDDGLPPEDIRIPPTSGNRPAAPEFRWWISLCTCPTMTGGLVIHRRECPMYVPLGLTFREPVRR